MCVDFAAGQVEFGLRDIGVSVGDLCVEAFDFSVQGVDLLTLTLRVSLRLGHLRAGDVSIGGEGGHAFFGHVTGFAQGFCAGQIHL